MGNEQDVGSGGGSSVELGFVPAEFPPGCLEILRGLRRPSDCERLFLYLYLLPNKKQKLERLDQRPHSSSLTRALEFGGEHVALTSLRRIHQDPCASLHLKIFQSNLTCLQKSPAMAVLEPYLSVQVATSSHFRTPARLPILNLTSIFFKHFLTG